MKKMNSNVVLGYSNASVKEREAPAGQYRGARARGDSNAEAGLRLEIFHRQECYTSPAQADVMTVHEVGLRLARECSE